MVGMNEDPMSTTGSNGSGWWQQRRTTASMSTQFDHDAPTLRTGRLTVNQLLVSIVVIVILGALWARVPSVGVNPWGAGWDG